MAAELERRVLDLIAEYRDRSDLEAHEYLELSGSDERSLDVIATEFGQALSALLLGRPGAR